MGEDASGKDPAAKSHRAGPADDARSPLQGEYANIILLLILYTLQGIPMGLFGVVNMDLKEIFKDSFSEQGTFMLAAWPFSLKLFWAPLVDSYYSEWFGRRKTWMVPAQLAIGFVLLFLAPRIDDLYLEKDVYALTMCFFLLYLLCATQDIAVDGWALTMLRPENAGYGSTCNAIGQTVGFTIGFMIPMAKLVPLRTFLFFWGTVFIATTVCVWVLKREAPTAKHEQIEGLEAYKTMWKVMQRPPVQLLAVHLLTRALAFIPADVMAAGYLQDSGFPKESIANIKLCVTPLEIVMPWILSSITAGPRPLSVILAVYIPRALLTALIGLFAFGAGDIMQPPPAGVYAAVFAFTILQGVSSNAMFVAHMAFFNKVSDPAIGGTYMTFLNTIHNFGNMVSSTICLKAADRIREVTGYNGFLALCALCTAYGVVWFILFAPTLRRLQGFPIADWRVAAS